MKILKFNESVNEDIYSLIDELTDVNTLIEDDLVDFRDSGYSLSTNSDGYIILKGKCNDIYDNIRILTKLRGLNINIKNIKLTDSKFKYVISNPKMDDLSKKIIDYFLKNLKFKKISESKIQFRLYSNDDGIMINIFDNLVVHISTGYEFGESDIYQKFINKSRSSMFLSGKSGKSEWIYLIELVKDCIDYAKKNNIKI